MVFKGNGVVVGLFTELGGVEQSTFGTQLKANLFSTNLNLSSETSKLIGGFARLGDGTWYRYEIDMICDNKRICKTTRCNPADVAGMLVTNTEKFGEYGKDGGKNMIQAW